MRLRINVCICNPTWIVASTSLFRACHGLLAESCPGASCEDRTFDEVGVWKPLGKEVEIKKWQSLPERAGQPVPLQ